MPFVVNPSCANKMDLSLSSFAFHYALPAVLAALAVTLTVKLVQRIVSGNGRYQLEHVCGGRPHDARMTVEFGTVDA